MKSVWATTNGTHSPEAFEDIK